MIIIDGKKLSEVIYSKFPNDLGSSRLAIILASEDFSSKKYVEIKKEKASSLGIQTEIYKVPKEYSKEKILDLINNLNYDNKIGGILVQLPLYEHLEVDRLEIINSIKPSKDVDGLTSLNLGLTLQNSIKAVLPATVDAILECINFVLEKYWDSKDEPQILQEPHYSYNLDKYEILHPSFRKLKGKNILVINKSNLIGKPLAMVLSNFNATVTIAHKYTKNIDFLIKSSDVVITATGQTGIINPSEFLDNTIVIDVTSLRKNGQVKGDVIWNEKILEQKNIYITPVPGGVGPLTVACLIRNFLKLNGRI